MGSATARDPGPPPLPVGEQLVALLGSVVVALEIAVEAEGVDDGRGEVLERPATREFDVAIEPTVELPRGAVGALRPYMTSASLGAADRTTVPVRWTDAGWPTPLARAVVRSASGWQGPTGRAKGRSWPPALPRPRHGATAGAWSAAPWSWSS